ncbi:MAG: TlyA family RNA methyltransferase [Oscillospiraceae bacterium]|nr:TlyA family RNA methyltransferase [Oscillospiraceae bacterium]
MPKERIRLDAAVVAQGHAPSREKAKALIMAGQVYVNGQKELKAGRGLREDDLLDVRTNVLPFVSRGGLKLQKAIDQFGIALDGKTCMDVGASTGGFTDCMLSCGAAKVYAVDVGYGQLAWKLRINPCVINLERTNFRYITAAQVPDAIDFASIDVSFISLGLIFPVLYPMLSQTGSCVCLVKPQFEAGRGRVGKRGVVREAEIHEDVLRKTILTVQQNGFFAAGLSFSPIKGPEGNIEFLLYLTKSPPDTAFEAEENIAPTVQAAHEGLL